MRCLKYHQDPDPPRHLAQARESAIRLADQNRVMRLALPAISMGIYGYAAEEAVPILSKTVAELCTYFTHLTEIRFVVDSGAVVEVPHRTALVITPERTADLCGT